jgi:hypothetical protein
VRRKTASSDREKAVPKRTFATLEQVTSHFFPKEGVESQLKTGKDRGTEAAEREFERVSRSR